MTNTNPFPINWGNIVNQGWGKVISSAVEKIENDKKNLTPKKLEEPKLEIQGNEPINYFTPNGLGKISNAWYQGTNNEDLKPKSTQLPNEPDTNRPMTIHLNPNHIMMSQISQMGLQALANNSPNSSANAILNYNTQQFSPLNYLPNNRNTSKQSLFGMKYGGIFKQNEEYNLTDEQIDTLKKLGYELEIL